MSDDALKEALSSHRPDPDQLQVEFKIPPRGPYERAAHAAVKNRLWKLGLKDQAVLDSLSNDQAKAVEHQIHEARRKVVAGIRPYKWPRRIFGWGFFACIFWSMVTASKGEAAFNPVAPLSVVWCFLLWAGFYAAAQSKLRSMGLGGGVSYAQGRAVYTLSRRL